MTVSGPIARNIADLGLALQAMAGEDSRDPWWMPAPLELGAPPGGRCVALSVVPEGLVVAPEVEAALRHAAAVLAGAGWTIMIGTPAIRNLIREAKAA